MIAEPDVTLTDYGLALECGYFAIALGGHRPAAGPLRRWFAVFFAATAAAALAGGTAHGLGDATRLADRLFWPAALIGIGAAALAAWVIAARLGLSPTMAGRLERAAAALLVVYVVAVLAGTRAFAVAVIAYVPAAVFLLGAFVRAYARDRGVHLLLGAGGLAVTLLAAGLQQAGVSLPPLGHNTLYHLIQAAGLGLLFVGARGIATREGAW
jgi:hypothetical protein